MKKVEKLVKEEYELPVCEFLAPKDMEFDCWEINGQRHLPGEKITLNEDITLKALWVKEDKSKEPKEPLLGEISSEDSSAMKVNCINSIGYKKEDSEYVNKINLITIRRNGKEIKHYLFTKEDGKYKNLDKTLDKVSIAFKDKTFFNRDDEIIISARGYKDLKLHIISADDNVMNALYITEIVSTVKFETFDGSKIDDQIIKVGLSSANKLAKVQDPTKDGYTFKGWYEDRELTKVFDFDKKIITDTTIFAKWVKNTPNTPSEEKNIELEVKNVTIHQHDTLDLKSLIVKAKDNKNNDLKEQVEIIDEGGFNKDKVGTYTITFKLTNKNVSVTKKATVTVVEKENSTVNPANPTNPTNPVNPGNKDPKTPKEKTQIKFLFGENQEIDNNKTLIFKLSPKVEDFEDVYVDDKLVDKSMYDVKKGSTIIEFKDEFIKQLSCEKHKFKFNFKEGSIETYILVKDSKEEQDKDRRNNPSLVKTSIQSASFMPLILSTIALVVVKRKRK